MEDTECFHWVLWRRDKYCASMMWERSICISCMLKWMLSSFEIQRTSFSLPIWLHSVWNGYGHVSRLRIWSYDWLCLWRWHQYDDYLVVVFSPTTVSELFNFWGGQFFLALYFLLILRPYCSLFVYSLYSCCSTYQQHLTPSVTVHTLRHGHHGQCTLLVRILPDYRSVIPHTILSPASPKAQC